MPIYEFHCAACGTFDMMRSLQDASKAARCPDCGGTAHKQFPVVNLRATSAAVRRAHETNERSAHAPHVCSSSCGHSHGSRKTTLGDRPVLQRSSKRNPRPWMLGH